jgi:hypothetical protein
MQDKQEFVYVVVFTDKSDNTTEIKVCANRKVAERYTDHILNGHRSRITADLKRFPVIAGRWL